VFDSWYIFLTLDLGWWCGSVVNHSTLVHGMCDATTYSTQEDKLTCW
jgi:hypothetical protein